MSVAKQPKLGLAEFFALPFPDSFAASLPPFTNHFSRLTFSASVVAHATSAFASNFYGWDHDGWAVEVPGPRETGRGR